VPYLQAAATIVAPQKILVNRDDGTHNIITTSKVLVATGSKPLRPAEIPFDDNRIFDSDTVNTLGFLPHRVVINGGGIIAILSMIRDDVQKDAEAAAAAKVPQASSPTPSHGTTASLRRRTCRTTATQTATIVRKGLERRSTRRPWYSLDVMGVYAVRTCASYMCLTHHQNIEKRRVRHTHLCIETNALHTN